MFYLGVRCARCGQPVPLFELSLPKNARPGEPIKYAGRETFPARCGRCKHKQTYHASELEHVPDALFD